MSNIKFIKVSAWKRGAVYQATNSKKTVVFEIGYFPDRIGVLKRVECTETGFFEEYKFENIKTKIKTLFT